MSLRWEVIRESQSLTLIDSSSCGRGIIARPFTVSIGVNRGSLNISNITSRQEHWERNARLIAELSLSVVPQLPTNSRRASLGNAGNVDSSLSILFHWSAAPFPEEPRGKGKKETGPREVG